MSAINPVVLFASIAGGAIVIVYGAKHVKTAVETSAPAAAPGSSTAAGSPGAAAVGAGVVPPNLKGGGLQLSGKVSNFGGPSDPTTGDTTAMGISLAANPGIAVYNHQTLGGYWRLTVGNVTKVVRQVDIGPAPWTGRLFDISYNLMSDLGSPATDSTASAVYLGKP